MLERARLAVLAVKALWGAALITRERHELGIGLEVHHCCLTLNVLAVGVLLRASCIRVCNG